MLRKALNLKLVRYGMSAGIATCVDVFMYFVSFNYLLQKRDLDLGASLVISAPTIALVISYSCGLLTNFTITKYFVFTESDLRGYHQLMRYVLVALLILVLNYGMMSVLIKGLHWYPTISRALSAVVIGLASFVIHRSFSFRNSGKSA